MIVLVAMHEGKLHHTRSWDNVTHKSFMNRQKLAIKVDIIEEGCDLEDV